MLLNANRSLATRVQERVAAVVDLDNIVLRPGRRGVLDVAALCEELRARGVVAGIVLAANVYPKDIARWRRYAPQLRFVVTSENADAEIAWYAAKYARRGFERVIVVSGDGELGEEILRSAAAHRTDIEFWATSESFSRRLKWLAQRSFYIDRFVSAPRPGDLSIFAKTAETTQ